MYPPPLATAGMLEQFQTPDCKRRIEGLENAQWTDVRRYKFASVLTVRGLSSLENG